MSTRTLTVSQHSRALRRDPARMPVSWEPEREPVERWRALTGTVRELIGEQKCRELERTGGRQ